MVRVTGLILLFLLIASALAQSAIGPNQYVPAQRPIAGQVVNEEGTPVPGARLWWGSGGDVVELLADADGRFNALSPETWKFTEGPCGLGTIWAEAEDYGLGSVTILGGDEQTRPELEVKVRLRRLPAMSKPGFRVVDPQGLPISGASVELSREYHGRIPTAILNRYAGRTNADGIVELPRLPLPGWHIRVTTPDYGLQELEQFTISGAPEPRTLALRACSRLEGRIGGTAESRRGLKFSVRSAGPEDDPQVRQENVKLGVRGVAAGIAAVEFDDEGRFTVPALAAGKLTFEVESPAEAFERPEAPRDIVIAAGSTTTIEIPMTKGVMVTGRVVDDVTGTPLVGVSVQVSSGRKSFVSTTTSTDRDGRFRTAALPGRATASIGSGGSQEAGRFMVPPPVPSNTIKIEPDSHEQEFREFRLTPARRIIGRVVTKDFPVQGMRVNVDRLPQPGQCGEDGYFLMSLPLDLEPKTYTVGSPIGPRGPAKVLSTAPLVLEMPEFGGLLIGP